MPVDEGSADALVTVTFGDERGNAKTEGSAAGELENGDGFAAFPPKIDDEFSGLVGVVNDDIEKMLPPVGAKSLDLNEM